MSVTTGMQTRTFYFPQITDSQALFVCNTTFWNYGTVQ